MVSLPEGRELVQLASSPVKISQQLQELGLSSCEAHRGQVTHLSPSLRPCPGT